MVKFTIYEKPFSINKAYYNNKAHGKTAAANEWSCKVLEQIHAAGEQFTELRKTWENLSAPKPGFHVSMTFNIRGMRAKAGQISKLSTDLSNVEKMLLDLLFLSKYHGQNPPYTALNMNLDDTWVTSLWSKKVAADDYSIAIEIKLDI